MRQVIWIWPSRLSLSPHACSLLFLVSLLHCRALCPLKCHLQNNFFFLLSSISSLNPCFDFFTRWYSFSTCGVLHLSLLSALSLRIQWCLQSSQSSLLTTIPFRFLLVSDVYCRNHWLWVFPELAVLLQTSLFLLGFPVLSFTALALKVLSIQLELICLTYFACSASQQAFSVFHKRCTCSSVEDSPVQWHT